MRYHPYDRPPWSETNLARDHPEDIPPGWQDHLGRRPFRWLTTKMKDQPNEKPSGWETNLKRDHPDDTPPWWQITLMRDHPDDRPHWSETTLMIYYPDERPTGWQLFLMTDHLGERPPWWEITPLFRSHLPKFSPSDLHVNEPLSKDHSISVPVASFLKVVLKEIPLWSLSSLPITPAGLLDSNKAPPPLSVTGQPLDGAQAVVHVLHFCFYSSLPGCLKTNTLPLSL